jgi:ATPase subunit of ABC transporter with duplicated ATPase domains
MGSGALAARHPTVCGLDSRLICLIGANEVGKSTLLDALELGYPDPNEDEDDPPRVGSLERTRDESVPDNRVARCPCGSSRR